MANRRFEMYQYRQILVRMRMGDSNRAIADSGVAGRNKVKAIKRIALEYGWLELDKDLPDDTQLAAIFGEKHPTQQPLHPLHLTPIKLISGIKMVCKAQPSIRHWWINMVSLAAIGR